MNTARLVGNPFLSVRTKHKTTAATTVRISVEPSAIYSMNGRCFSELARTLPHLPGALKKLTHVLFFSFCVEYRPFLKLQ